MEAINVLLEGVPKDVNLTELRKSLEGVNGVTGLHDLHVWSLTSGINAMSAHVVIENINDHNILLKQLTETTTQNFKIVHTTFQIEDEKYEEDEVHL